MVTIAQERQRLAAVGMTLRRREQWGSTFNYGTVRSVDEPATRVFVHISVTNPGNYSSFDAHARALEAIGRSRFPATGISYNRLFMAGTRAIYEGQPMGRRGAHTVNDFRRSTCSTPGCPGRGSSLTAPSWNLNVNARAYAICQNVGHSVPDHMVDDLARAIAADKLAGLVTKSAAIHGHRCVSSKSCPGDRMWARMGELNQKVNRYVANGLPGSGGTTPPPPPPPTKDWFDMATKKDLADVVDERLNNAVIKHTEKNNAWHIRTLESRTANIRADQARVLEGQSAILAAVDGLDASAITARLDAHHAEYLARFEAAESQRAELLGLVERQQSGELTAQQVVDELSRRLGGPDGGEES